MFFIRNFVIRIFYLSKQFIVFVLKIHRDIDVQNDHNFFLKKKLPVVIKANQ